MPAARKSLSAVTAQFIAHDANCWPMCDCPDAHQTADFFPFAAFFRPRLPPRHIGRLAEHHPDACPTQANANLPSLVGPVLGKPRHEFRVFSGAPLELDNAGDVLHFLPFDHRCPLTAR